MKTPTEQAIQVFEGSELLEQRHFRTCFSDLNEAPDMQNQDRTSTLEIRGCNGG